MKCPFCAETIQDEAAVCRFCNAEKRDGQWQRWSPQPPRPAGAITMQIAGWLFGLSAVFEAASLTQKVPLFGALRGGLIAFAYHMLFIGLFAILAYAFLRRTPWTYRLTLIGTGVITLDKLIYILDREGRLAALKDVGSGLIDKEQMESLLSVTVLMTLVTMLCWWGFAAFVHYRRAYFLSAAAPPPAPDPAKRAGGWPSDTRD